MKSFRATQDSMYRPCYVAGYAYGKLVPSPLVTIQGSNPDLRIVLGGYYAVRKDLEIYVKALVYHRVRASDRM